ncbi:MAG: HPr family phosphocarrier protein [Planctomycetota bacterium]
MASIERQITIQNDNGLHARPAMQFVDCANAFSANITVIRAADHPEGPAEADAKSVMQMLTLAATKGTILTVVAEGDDAEDALKQLEQMVHDKFGEES